MTSPRNLLPSLCVLGVLGGSLQADETTEKVTYQDHVKPIMREHCMACHSQDDASSGLALDDYGATLAGGAGGEVLAAGDPDGSRLWRLVTHQEGPEMPPGEKIPEGQLEVIKKWIEGGLLDNAGSKPKKAKKSAVAQVEVTENNRPVGEPAMPEEGWFTEPVVSAEQVGPITTLAASPWAPLVAVPWQHQVSLYHVGEKQAGSLELLGVLPYPDGAPNVVRFSRDGSLLLVAGGVGATRGSAAVFDVKSGERLVTVGDELDAVLAADISPDRSMVAIGGPKKKVRVFSTADGEMVYDVSKHTDWVTALEFSPDGQLLATADRNSGLLVWQADSGNPRADLRGHKGAVTDVAWRGDSQVLASSDEEGEVRVWRRDGQPIRNFRAHGGGAMAVDFADDGRLATAGRDRKVTVWDQNGKATKQCGPMKESSLAAVFTCEDQRVVASDFGGVVQAFDTESGESLGELVANPPTLAVRLATAEARRERIQGKLKPAKEALANAEAMLKSADEAHAVYAKQLAEAQAKADAAKKSLATADKEMQSRAADSAAKQKSVASSDEVLKAAEQALAVVEKQLSEDANQEAGEGGPTEVLKALTTAVEHARRGATQSAEQSAKATKQLTAAQQAAEAAKIAQVEADKLLAQISNQQSGLPDLKAARAAVEKARAESMAIEQELAQVETLIAGVTGEMRRFEQALGDWTKQAEELAAERDRLATEAEKTAQAMTAADERVSADRKIVDELAAKLAELREQLKQKQAAKDAATAKADEAAQQLADAEAAAARAEARRSAFLAAEELRERYVLKGK